eukprot:TRINITY_DN19009_c0_g1_i1.p1 TRINITY_DN19009_c0_g1~~TRINITY_DN19009_c0_g1_i1.p1  ORF type:complete len:936 (-),score=218.11 TRINITY_DN19009_c0_g1_i1:245-3052(-)
MQAQAQKSLHVCFLGDPGCGHSAFLRTYQSAYGAIPGGCDDGRQIESFVAMVELDGEPYRARFTDNAGLECFNSFRDTVLTTAHVIVLCFNIEKPETLQHIEDRWFPMLWETQTEAPRFVVGFRSDLTKGGQLGNDPTFRPEEKGVELAERQGAFGYLECSMHHPETVVHVATEVLQAAKDYFTLQWQLGPRPISKSGSPDDVADDAPWKTHERMNVADDYNPLDKEQLKKSLSMVGFTPERKHAYLRSDLSNLALTSVDVMRPYIHLQFVNLSGNRLKTLEPLGVLQSVLHLNVSYNLLVRTQSFAAPDRLETLDMSYNMIGNLGEWRVHRFLRELNLRGNFIDEIGPGLLHLKELRMLDMSENNLANIQNLENLGLNTLFLAQNRLESLEGVETLSNLQVLNVRHNNITSLAALRPEELPRLRKLCLADNRLSRIADSVERLPGFDFLCDLLLSPNPLIELPHYREQVLHRLPRLRSLDNELASAEEKVKADLIYAADVDQRREAFEKLLPAETFVDRRLVTEQGVAALEQEKFGLQGDTGAFGSADTKGGAWERSQFQTAQFAQRLALARRGGEPQAVADFARFAAPFLSTRVRDSDLQALLEACGDGRIETLILCGCDLTPAGLMQLVAFLQECPRLLRFVDLSGCAGVGEVGRELITSFPYATGCSFEVNDCGLTDMEVVRLRNATTAAEEARRRYFEAWQRSETMIAEYDASAASLEAAAAERLADPYTVELCQSLSRASAALYDVGDVVPNVASGQLMAHLTYLAYGCLPSKDSPLKLPAKWRLKRLGEVPRLPARHGLAEDLHTLLASGQVILEYACGKGIGPGGLALTLLNTDQRDLQVAIRRGSVFQQAAFNHQQDLMVASEYVVTVPAGRRTWKAVEVYSINVQCAPPRESEMHLTDFYFDDLDILETQGSVWEHFEACYKASD